MYRGGLSAKSSARLASAIISEFGKTDGLVVIDWLIERIQYADGLFERAVKVADNHFVPRNKIKTKKGKRK